MARLACGIELGTTALFLHHSLEAEVAYRDDIALLGRLESSVVRLSQFSADLAHKMRTPLHTLLASNGQALFERWVLAADASWEVDLWGRVLRQVEAANAQGEGATDFLNVLNVQRALLETQSAQGCSATQRRLNQVQL